MRKPIIKRLPVIFTDATPTKIARFLIEQSGGVGAAHDHVTRAGKAMKKLRGKPPIDDTHLLLIARAIQKHDRCSPRSALKQAAELATKDQQVETVLRRLQDKIKGTTLAKFARSQPFNYTRIEKNEFALSLRD